MARIALDVTLNDIDDWFSIGKTVVKSEAETVSRTSQQERNQNIRPKQIEKRRYIPSYRREARDAPSQLDYGQTYKNLEEQQLLSTENEHIHQNSQGGYPSSSGGGDMEALEVESLISGITNITLPEGLTEAQAKEVYNNYNFQHQYDDKLSITKYREEIVNTIETNRVTVIEGPTGSGKTTQVAQYILDHYARTNQYCNIVVTQPRRIAAISIAKRVCHERDWQLGSICGYQIAMDKMASEDTRLMYCTTGVLLQKLINQKDMRNFTHIMLDEVHERDKDSDFNLLIVRKLLRLNSGDVKVILMSATFDTKKFAEYFAIPVRGVLEPAPIVSVEGRQYQVAEYYIEDLKPLGPLPQLDPSKPGIEPEALALGRQLVLEFDTLEIKQQGQTESGFAKKRGSVLVFLPGIGEIRDFEEALDTIKEDHKLQILPLHSTITGEEQARVFNMPDYPRRKVILSTNIAESSITVPDIKYVIDFCLTRELRCDRETNYTSLQVDWASRANCDQRKGRAGRVSNGRVYRMITRDFWEEQIQEFGTPEMQRCPLEALVLQAKVLDMGEPKAILGLALSPPALGEIERTVLVLKEVGALKSMDEDMFNPYDGRLTFMGRVLAQLPVDIRVGKLILMGHVFGMLDDCVIIAAALSLKSFFSRPFRAAFEAYKMKLNWADGSLSDCQAILNAYKMYQKEVSLGKFERQKRAELEWGRKKFIQIKRIREVHDLITDLKNRLRNFNIESPMRAPRNRSPQDDKLLLKLLLCGAFYPHYFTCSKGDEADAVKAMSGKNPATNVMVRGLPCNQGLLYIQRIQDIFHACHPRPQVQVEDTKAFIEFPREANQSGNQLPVAIYLAIKMRQLNTSMLVELLHPEVAQSKMMEIQEALTLQAKGDNRLRTNRINLDQQGAGDAEIGICQVDFPSPTMSYVPIHITEVVTCGHFWGHNNDKATWPKLQELDMRINQYVASAPTGMKPGSVKEGALCLGPFNDGGEVRYYRAVVESVQKYQVKVFFGDYGNHEIVHINQLFPIPDELMALPFQSMEFELAKIKPSAIMCSSGVWTEEAQNLFISLVQGQQLFAQVYSVVDGVLRINLYRRSDKQCINQQLIDQNYADSANESYISEQNHLVRAEEALSPIAKPMKSRAHWLNIKPKQLNLTPTLQSRQECRQHIELKGPDNPLELTFYPLPSSGKLRPARTDRESVNSVALDDEPQNRNDRMMVACYVGLNPGGTTVMARETTILPNIPGLPAIMALLFCPTAELRTDEKRTKYIGVLCGLGSDPVYGESIMGDSDVEITFDVHIDERDLEMINLVRMTINFAIGGDEDHTNWSLDDSLKLQQLARERLLNVIQRRREFMEKIYFPTQYEWNQVRPEDILRPQMLRPSGPGGQTSADQSMDSFLQDQLFKHHCAIALNPPEDVQNAEDAERKLLQEQQEHIGWLRKQAGDSTARQEIMCELCNVKLLTARELKLHLATRKHREKETKIVCQPQARR